MKINIIDVVLLVCMECFQGSSCLTGRSNVAFIPESGYKGMAIFHTTKIFRLFFCLNFKLFSSNIDFQQLTKC